MSGSTITSFSDDNGAKINIGSVDYRVQNANEDWSLDLLDSTTLLFSVRPDDNWQYDSATRERSEIASTQVFAPGTDISMSYEFMVQDGVANTADWLLIGQFHANDQKTSPPFAVEMKGEKMWIMIRYKTGDGNIVSNYVYKDSQDIDRGHFYSMKVEADFSMSGGYLRVWRDGVQIVDYEGPLGYDNGVYWKQGIYRVESNETISVAFRNLNFGDGPAVADGGETIKGTNEGETLVGTPGNDVINSAGGSDTVLGVEGSDNLNGATGSDVIRGSGGNDKLIGGKGNDKLDGEAGNDVLKGCKGNDTFYFVESFGADVVKDFKPGSDTICFVGVFANFDEVKDAMSGGKSVVITSDFSSITFKGVSASKLDADDFLFA